MEKTLKNIINTFTALFLIIITFLLYICSYFIIFLFFTWPSEALLKFNVSRNKNFASVEILVTELEVLSYEHNIKICTKDEYRIYVKKVNWTLRGDDIHISQVNDIKFFGGQIYEITNDSNIFYNPTDIIILGKMIGKELDSVNDIIDNRKDLYELFKYFESKSRKKLSDKSSEFIYKNRFIVNADFAKEGSPSFDILND